MKSLSHVGAIRPAEPTASSSSGFSRPCPRLRALRAVTAANREDDAGAVDAESLSRSAGRSALRDSLWSNSTPLP